MREAAEKTETGGEFRYSDEDALGEISLEIDKIVQRHTKVDWHDNPDVHKKIEQEIDDLLFDTDQKKGIKLSLEQIDEIIENVKTIAQKRY